MNSGVLCCEVVWCGVVCQVLTDGRSAACIVRDGHTTHTPSPTHHIVANTAAHCNGRRKGSRQHIGRMFQPAWCVARDLVGDRESTSTCTGQHSPTTDTMRQRATYTWMSRARCVQYLSPRAAKRPSETIQALRQWADVTRCRRSGHSKCQEWCASWRYFFITHPIC